MVMLKPFRPLRYNPAVVGDLSAVVAPPYDVISDAHRDLLHERSPFNVVHLILNRAADPYSAAADLLTAWRAQGALVREAQPIVGYHLENFVLPNGSPRQREGIIGVVRLEPFASGHIRPHERTFARAKEDRMRLLRACRTNLSPIFGLYADREAVIDPARAAATRRAPDIDVHDDAGVRHRLWLLAEPEIANAIAAGLRDETVFIADGHHRYETALAYRDVMRRAGDDDRDAPHNFILMYLTSMSHPGLVILPTHRIFRRLPEFEGGAFVRALRRSFRVRQFGCTARQEFLAALRQAPQHGRFGMVLADGDDLLIADQVNTGVLGNQAADRAAAVRHLDVTVLDTLIVRGILGVDATAAAQAGDLTYTHDDDAALDAVSGGAQAAFLMNPPRIEDVQAVCLAGETMPEKSTYFYPKLASGLVFHPLETPGVC